MKNINFLTKKIFEKKLETEDYKLKKFGVQRIDTGEFIPENEENSHWQRYLEWKKLGNKPKPEFTLDELKNNRWKEAIDIMNSRKEGGVIVNKKVICSSPEIKSDIHSLLLEIDSGAIKQKTYFIVNKHPHYQDSVELTEEELRAAHKAQTKLYHLCYENSKTLQDLIFSSKDPYSIDINQGWPATPFINDEKK